MLQINQGMRRGRAAAPPRSRCALCTAHCALRTAFVRHSSIDRSIAVIVVVVGVAVIQLS